MRRLREDDGLRALLTRQGLLAAEAANWQIRARQFLQACDAS
jgi:hypothetical protein